MDKREILKALLSRGIMVSPELLENMSEDKFRLVLENSEASALVVDSVMAAKPAERPEAAGTATGVAAHAQEPPPSLSIEVMQFQESRRLGPADFAAYYNKKYIGIREILLKKTSAVSISNAGNGAPVTVIGMVRDVRPNGFAIEDPSGSLDVSMKTDGLGIGEDDVIALTGMARQGRMFGKEITWPDVPLTHPVMTIDATVVFSENLEAGQPGADMVCSPAKITHEQSGASAILPNPAWITISRPGRHVTLLVYRPDREAGLADAVEMLKKRHLSPGRGSLKGPDDPFLLERIPDVFWILSGEKGIKTYKGVTILSCGKASIRLDLATRKAEFI